MQLPFIFRRLLKTKSLRLINLAGLTLMFTCILVSYSYVKKELSYDRFYTKSERIARFTISYGGKQADGRIWGDNVPSVLKKCPEIEDTLELIAVSATTLTYNDKKTVINNLMISSKNFFRFFDIPLLEGDSQNVFDAPGKIVISEKLAMELYGKTDIIGEKMQLSGRQYALKDVFVSGVFENIPDNSHFHTDIIVYEEDLSNMLRYVYVLLKENVSPKELSAKVTGLLQEEFKDSNHETVLAEIMPLTDIHLHSRALREIEPNGNIDYIYLIAGANALLFVIVLFNLWLNSNVIFAYNRRYYQLLRLNGASPYSVVKEELATALFLSIFSLLFGKLISIYMASDFGILSGWIPLGEEICLLLLLGISSILVALIPVIKGLSITLFSNQSYDLKPIRFSFSNVRYMLVVQYAIVIFIIIVAAGINKQVSIIKTTQIAATNDSIVVLKEQVEDIVNNYSLLRSELLKHPEIESVTGAMQLPGEAVRDMTRLKVEGNNETITCPILIVGDDFFPFFNIKPIAGNLPPLLILNKEDEQRMSDQKSTDKNYTTSIKDYLIINRKAMQLLGFSSPEDAIGKDITIMHQSLDYIPSGTIYGVVDNFVYANVYEESTPMVIIQRNLFVNCFMLRLSPNHTSNALNILHSVWEDVNPDYPLSYKFLKDSYGVIYRNEINAEHIINLFSGLCLIITILGLIIFMAFMIKGRTKEIGIRKVNGASDTDILYMLNRSLLVWIVLAFIIAVPTAWYVITRWLENFAYKAIPGWWIYAGAGIIVAVFSLAAVTWQSWKAAKINPVETLKSE